MNLILTGMELVSSKYEQPALADLGMSGKNGPLFCISCIRPLVELRAVEEDGQRVVKVRGLVRFFLKESGGWKQAALFELTLGVPEKATAPDYVPAIIRFVHWLAAQTHCLRPVDPTQPGTVAPEQNNLMLSLFKAAAAGG